MTRSRPAGLETDLPGLTALLGRTRASGGFWHPGGIQWWLRKVVEPRFEAHVWEANADVVGFVLIDGTSVVDASDAGGPSRLELIVWAEQRLRALRPKRSKCRSSQTMRCLPRRSRDAATRQRARGATS